MRIQQAARSLGMLAAVVALATSAALAQTSGGTTTQMNMAPSAPVPHASQLIKVNGCNPALNVTQSGGFVGYTPGYWGGGPYWGDVYGARFYQPPITTTNPELGVDYVNISPKTMHTIEFGLIVNGVLVAEVRDVGTFTNGAEIKHKFGISANVFPLRTGLPQCVPLRITFADGTKWRNPRLPPKNQHIYYNP